MFSKVLSAAVYGVQSRLVQVEADSMEGLPSFSMVGYLSTQVKEAQDRVRTALKNSGIYLQPKKITVNLSPADLHKSGTGFDLPIAVAIAASYGMVPKESLENTIIVGELSLNGRLNAVSGILPIAADAGKFHCSRMIVPCQNQREAKAIQGLEVIGAGTLKDVLEYLQSEELPENQAEEREEIQIEHQVDFSEVKGQETVKRAALIAAAGFHNLLMIGPPGSGKSMIARRIGTILPELTMEESIELSRVYSVLGMIPANGSLLRQRPYRAPHHTITSRALCGGGHVPKPGEISLAHKGVLFLDELPEFHRETLEILRQPLESGEVQIARAGYQYTFPSQFMLIGAMNPCPCGYYPDLSRCQCTCTEVKKYLGKVSQPLLDRMDMTIEVSRVPFLDLEKENSGTSSIQMRRKVESAREIQKRRMSDSGKLFNSQMETKELECFCRLDGKSAEFMKKAFDEMKLSARGYGRILKVARTIADLEGAEEIDLEHLQEALCYRSTVHMYWKGR